MSGEAMRWAALHAPTQGLNVSDRHVLKEMAWYAHLDGRNAFPSVRLLVRRTGLSERCIRGSIRRLSAAGLIRPGDTARVKRYASNQRPNVWDLTMHVIKACGTETEAARDRCVVCRGCDECRGKGCTECTGHRHEMHPGGVPSAPKQEDQNEDPPPPGEAALPVPTPFLDRHGGRTPRAMSLSPPNTPWGVEEGNTGRIAGRQQSPDLIDPKIADGGPAELLNSILKALPADEAASAAPARRRLRPLVAAASLAGHDAEGIIQYVRSSWPGVPPRSPAGLLMTLLRDASECSPTVHEAERRRLGCIDCTDGWLSTTDDEVAVPCPRCRPHTVRKERS